MSTDDMGDQERQARQAFECENQHLTLTRIGDGYAQLRTLQSWNVWRRSWRAALAQQSAAMQVLVERFEQKARIAHNQCMYPLAQGYAHSAAELRRVLAGETPPAPGSDGKQGDEEVEQWKRENL